MKIICTFLMVVAVALCEPPVPSNQYLPAGQSGFNGGSPSSQYGVPGIGGNFGGGAPSQSYGVPGNGIPSQSYGVPGQNGGGAPPSQQYGVPSSRGNGGFGGRNGGFGGRRPSSSFGGGARRPSSSYGAPGNGITGAVLRPSSEYGAPSFNNQQPNNAYLPPNGNGNGNNGNGGYNYGRGGNGNGNGYDDGPSEPANYQFEYMVNDPPSGNDFGHMESRQGDYTQGRYYVVLPDGRKQIVDYEADQNGYRPKISYEEGYARFNGGNNGNGNGYGRGPAGGQNGGYSSNGGYAANGGYNY